MNNPWSSAFPAFRIHENLYFVGSLAASCHLIDTGDGLILIDTGFPQTLYLLIDSIHRLGFDPRDIRYILHTHGHYDHLGGTKALVEMTGAKTFIGEPDAPYADGSVDLTWARELGHAYHEAFKPDVLLHDGDVVSLGNTAIRCVHTPGHTPGTMSMFFDVGGYRAGFFGGVGLNTLDRGWCEKNHMPLTCRDDYRASLARLRAEKVELQLGPHKSDNNLAARYEKLAAGEGNPFLDETSWLPFLDACERQLDEICKK